MKWSSDIDTAFNELKGKLINEPVLYRSDFSLAFVFRTDASATGVGADLQHEFDDGKLPNFLSE